ncbi:hypothetical protein CpipJ_CPIJ003398 [Culex quinquefasciatus]|uniref:Uncharacterized protein n=1 Tax=Culex quinquefasciatus TaxID=7176 RepID=B0W809_CULQU|nr:hypothetical protein CpipJ_CPIJ003398 [Culex quinquefasciatus]|eukprot:XP_001844843.1 hypothetical protein CpipJ_CPIJ003398 [Culex quinquefasciatus]
MSRANTGRLDEHLGYLTLLGPRRGVLCISDMLAADIAQFSLLIRFRQSSPVLCLVQLAFLEKQKAGHL